MTKLNISDHSLFILILHIIIFTNNRKLHNIRLFWFYSYSRNIITKYNIRSPSLYCIQHHINNRTYWNYLDNKKRSWILGSLLILVTMCNLSNEKMITHSPWVLIPYNLRVTFYAQQYPSETILDPYYVPCCKCELFAMYICYSDTRSNHFKRCLSWEQSNVLQMSRSIVKKLYFVPICRFPSVVKV